jgi:ceramide glucosyltransferase
VKGLEPYLYECIASTFHQDYPVDRVSIRLCVDSKNDPAYPTLQKIVRDFPDFDAQVLVETDSLDEDGYVDSLGPNPKIRNISRAYREAKGDVIWVVDCNVWVPQGVLGRMVDKLMGYTEDGQTATPYKFVHQLPIVVDVVDYSKPMSSESQQLLSSASEAAHTTDMGHLQSTSLVSQIWSQGGGRLDELFMATTHAKFYGAINIVGIAPCVIGKSNMFRKSHLDRVTDPAKNSILSRNEKRPRGVDFFSHNICEDHSIGELIWRTDIAGFANHGLVWGDLVIQPMAGMSVSAYVARRVRWLRARKYTVLAATLVEPGVESLLCGLYFSFAATTLPWFQNTIGIPQTWQSMGAIWATFVTAWMLADWTTFCRLHSARSVQIDELTPFFAKGTTGPTRIRTRHFLEWLPAWIGREVMALPIWTWAVLLGGTVNWRGKTFKVRPDTTVEEIFPSKKTRRD